MSATFEPIAIVAAAARVPGADDITDLRQLLRRTPAAPRRIPPTRWAADEGSGLPTRGRFLTDPFSFDHALFDLTAEQAIRIDPQQRLMLETGRQALDAAGMVRRPGNVGVFVGARMNGYGHEHAAAAERPSREAAAAALWGRSQNFIAAWFADRFNLSGPALVVDTACSSSLTAIWLACQALHAGQCDAALAGGVDLLIDPLTFTLLGQAGALAADGQSKTFDPAADGYGPGEGAGALVLKPHAAATRDGDTILGAIVAARANNDGSTMGVTTPDVGAQIALLRSVYETLDARALRYVETHGTGTTIGDPIETQALSTVLHEHQVPTGSVALGAVKRSIGHLHSAAGVVSVVSSLIALEDGPATLHLDSVNPRLRLADTPLYVPLGEPQAPQPVGDAALAGVSAFGFGGTNIHVAVQRQPTRPGGGVPDQGPQLLLLSAPTGYQLADLATQWVQLLRQVDTTRVPALCAAARTRPATLGARLAVTAAAPDALADELQRAVLTATDPGPAGSIALGSPRAGDTQWLPALATAHPAAGALLTAITDAAGVTPQQYPAPLARLAAVLAVTAALAELGVPAAAITLSDGWDAAAGTAWGAAGLGAALTALTPAAIAPEQPDDTTTPGIPTVMDRLRAAVAEPASLTLALLDVVAAAHTRGFDITTTTGLTDSPNSTPLPQFPYSGPSLRLAEPTRTPAPGQPTQLEPPIEPGSLAFHRTYSPGEHVIAQHEVNQRPMMPGVGWLQLIGEGVTAAGGTFHGVSDLVFHQPLMPEQPTRVTCRVEIDNTLTISGDDERTYVTGVLLRQAQQPAAAVDLRPLLAKAHHLTSGTELYRWLRRLGYYHGRYFRNISWLAATGTMTIAAIDGSRQRDIDPAGTRWSPGLLDSVTIAGVDPASDVYGHDEAPMFVPLSAAQVTVHADLADAAYVVTESLHRSLETCRLTQHILDATGAPLLTLHEVSSKRVPAGSFTHTQRAARPAIQNQPTTLPAAPRGRASAAPAPPTAQEEAAEPVATSAPAVTDRLLHWVLEQVGTSHADREFLDLGLDSLTLVDLSSRIEEELDVQLYPTVMFEHPTPAAFTTYLRSLGANGPPGQPHPADAAPALAHTMPEEPTQAAPVHRERVQTPPAPWPIEPAAVNENDNGTGGVSAQHAPAGTVDDAPGEVGERDVAIVGMAVRVPRAETLSDYWRLVTAGESTVGPAPAARVAARADLTGIASFLDRVDQFDPAPFRVSPREAPQLDPQARIVYETIWHALEDAGWNENDNVGLWIGYSHDHYYEERVRAGQRSGRGLGLEAMIANRLSYAMDWTGPSSVVNTLCSSGLVGLHQAMRSLRGGECDLAVVAGVHAGIGPEYLHSMGELMALSPTGACRAFDASADGFAPGEGAVAVILQRAGRGQSRARRPHAILKGSAVRHNGRTTRYSAPSPAGQSRAISAALADARVQPGTIGLLEAHGTGTRLGDPIEVEGLTSAWGSEESQFCALGSVKSVIGHLEPAAGLASLVKVVLAIQHRTIPATLHVERPNEHLHLEQTPFYLADRSREWVSDQPRRAAVSAFGMGGVNAHVIVQEAPAACVGAAADGPFLLRVSAASDAALAELAGRYRAHLQRHPGPAAAADLCAAATAGRASLRRRHVIAAATVDELAGHLEAAAAGRVEPSDKPATNAQVAFVFSGQGSQYQGMLSGLADRVPAVAAAVAQMDRALTGDGAPPVARIWGLPDAGLAQTENAQVAVVASHVAIATALTSWGIHPQAVAGHSVGELSAAWAAGCLDLPDLMRLTLTRARAMQAQPGDGAMAAVHAPRAEVEASLAGHPGVQIAAHNTARSLTVSGPRAAIEQYCAGSGLRSQLLNVGHAFHSVAMSGAGATVAEHVSRLVDAGRLAAPRIRFASTATGTWHDEHSVQDRDTWAHAITDPVLFEQALTTLEGGGFGHALEISATPVLTPMVRGARPQAWWLPTLRRDSAGEESTPLYQLHQSLQALSSLVEPDWAAVHPPRPTCTIPSYPFQRERYWITKGAS